MKKRKLCKFVCTLLIFALVFTSSFQVTDIKNGGTPTGNVHFMTGNTVEASPVNIVLPQRGSYGSSGGSDPEYENSASIAVNITDISYNRTTGNITVAYNLTYNVETTYSYWQPTVSFLSFSDKSPLYANLPLFSQYASGGHGSRFSATNSPYISTVNIGTESSYVQFYILASAYSGTQSEYTTARIYFNQTPTLTQSSPTENGTLQSRQALEREVA